MWKSQSVPVLASTPAQATDGPEAGPIRQLALARYRAAAERAAGATDQARSQFLQQASAAASAAQKWRDMAVAQYRSATYGAGGTTDQARDSVVQQASSVAAATQAVLDAAKAQGARRSVDVAQALGRMAGDAGPAVRSLAGQTRDYAAQKSVQAKELLAPSADTLAQTIAKQRDDLTPVIEDWAEQARERLSDLGTQAKEELAPALAGLVDQTRGRVGQLSAQAKDQLVPVAVELAAQARDRAAQFGSQTRDTASALQSSAASVVPAVSDTAGETAAAVGGAFDATGRAVRSTVTNLLWLTVLGGIAVFLYAPKDEERAKLLADLQEWASYAVDIVTELRGGE
jgi:hypothetical protein